MKKLFFLSFLSLYGLIQGMDSEHDVIIMSRIDGINQMDRNNLHNFIYGDFTGEFRLENVTIRFFKLSKQEQKDQKTRTEDDALVENGVRLAIAHAVLPLIPLVFLMHQSLYNYMYS